MSSPLRRILLLLMFVGAVAAAATWWRDRTDGAVAHEPPEWPPFEPLDLATTVATASSTATPATASTGWVAGTAAGEAPDGYPIKAKDSSGIFHVPDGRFYDRTNPDRWYSTEAAAEADGYRRSKT